ncbi:possible membrane protein [Rhodococcus jostii RHA1]|uniref:Possible membrane protein n=1 Tax=Rhodococcus jostii (strain RHA1) TaxID=101510 RepID=Q0SAP3_RHOJR|nr:possible membrane protein [Rhodococcus jostii RHA1]
MRPMPHRLFRHDPPKIGAHLQKTSAEEGTVFHRGDDAVTEEHSLDESLLVEPESRSRPWREFLVSTPGRLSVLGIALVTAALATGAITSAAIGARQQRIETLRTHTEPLTYAAERLYSSLSIADAAAATSFISGGVEPIDVRNRYNQAIGDASNALVTASNGVDSTDAAALALLSEISRDLADYTSLIATARANNRSGNPVGVAYLSDASTMMQDTILPAAESLYSEQSRAVADTQVLTARLPRAASAVAVALLVALVLAQVYLARKSKRRVNPGLVLASLLAATLLIWLAAATLVSTAATDRARTQGAQPLGTITQARILAQQARADETLALLQRGSDEQSEVDYARRSAELADILGALQDGDHGPATTPPIDAAVTALGDWRRAHTMLQEKLDVGDYPGAKAIAIGPADSASPATFAALDESLQDGIDRFRSEELDGMADAYRSLSLLAVGSMVIGVLCGFAVGGGIWPRLNEYH